MNFVRRKQSNKIWLNSLSNNFSVALTIEFVIEKSAMAGLGWIAYRLDENRAPNARRALEKSGAGPSGTGRL